MPSKKLLVADDSLTIQKVIKLALSNEGYTIQAVSEGNDTIQQIFLFRPDIILIDVALPGKSAFEVKRAINQTPEFHQVRFVLMSSAFENVDEVQVEEVGFHGRLIKPFDPAHLRQILTDALNLTVESQSAAAPEYILSENVSTDVIEETSPLSKPMEPEGMPILPSESANEVITELWETNPGALPPLTLPPMATPQSSSSESRGAGSNSPESNSQSSGNDEKSEIEALTRSTFGSMDSTLESFSQIPTPTPPTPRWEISPPPAPPFQSQSPVQSEGLDLEWNIHEPMLKPLGRQISGAKPPAPQWGAEPMDMHEEVKLEDQIIIQDDLSLVQPEVKLETRIEFPSETPSSKAPPLKAEMKPASAASVDVLLQDQLQTKVQDQLASAIEKLLPEMAERLIKQEIQKLLSE